MTGWTIKMEVDLTQAVGIVGVHPAAARSLRRRLRSTSRRTASSASASPRSRTAIENLQSSAVRIPFDRDDAINSGAPGERDLGVWLHLGAGEDPPRAQDADRQLIQGRAGLRRRQLSASTTARASNRPELNGNKHVVARVAYPFAPAARPGPRRRRCRAYTGIFVIPPVNRTPGVGGGEHDFRDAARRPLGAAHRPGRFGLQAEWTWGTGPEYDNVLERPSRSRT